MGKGKEILASIPLSSLSRDGFEQKLMKPSRAEPSAPWFRAEPSPFKGIESSRAETEPSQSKAIFCTESAFSLFDRKQEQTLFKDLRH